MFFVLRESICIVLLISSSLHITGSIFHLLARSTKSTAYFNNGFLVSSDIFGCCIVFKLKNILAQKYYMC